MIKKSTLNKPVIDDCKYCKASRRLQGVSDRGEYVTTMASISGFWVLTPSVYGTKCKCHVWKERK